MKDSERKIVWAATAVTALYEVLISSPWWSGMRIGSYDMLIRLTIPSLFLIMLAHYLLLKRQTRYASLMALFVICLQLGVGFTIAAALRGLLP